MSQVKTYYTVIPCCASSGTATNYFNFPIGTPNVNGTFKYNGATQTINGITFTAGFCYTFSPIGVSFTDYSTLPDISEFTATKSCTNSLCYDCVSPLPVDLCFNLFSCNGDHIVTNTDLTAYVNTFISIVGEGDTCWYVSQTSLKDCTSPDTREVEYDSKQCGCQCTCYQITGDPTSIYYVDCDLVEHTIVGSSQICSVIPPVVIGGTTGTIYNFGNCVEGNCPEHCFEFTNCQTNETLVVSNTPQITQYFIDEAIVTLMGYDGCWSIALSNDCSCAINVTVLQVYTDCATCLPVIAYKFTNCDNSALTKYSTDDYSAYVNQVVKLDCGDCWTISQIDYIPPAVQPITILTNYESCIACSRTYYELTDCAGIQSAIYTYTDLSDNINNTIKLKNCETCWNITELTNPSIEISSIADTVILDTVYADCETCNTVIPCKCSIAWPNESGVLSYIDCNGGTINLTGLDPLVQSERVCVREWLIAREPIFYDDCIDTGTTNPPTYVCPEVVLPKRFIKPGYTTPVCDTAKYEKISCNSSEILYKTVLNKRYGISNCCDGLDDKWLLKKELINLQAAMDPNYTCTPVSSCNCGGTCQSCKYQ